MLPPLEGEEEKDDVDFTEMIRELESFVQRLEDLAVEVFIRSRVISARN